MSKTNQKYYIVRVILFEIKNYVHASFTTHPFTTQKASCSPTNYNIKTKQNTEKHLYIKKILHHSNVWKNVNITIWTRFQYRWLHLEWVLHQQWMDATNTYILSDRFTSQKLVVCVYALLCSMAKEGDKHWAKLGKLNTMKSGSHFKLTGQLLQG